MKLQFMIKVIPVIKEPAIAMGSDEERQNFVSNILNTKAVERLQEIVGDKNYNAVVKDLNQF